MPRAKVGITCFPRFTTPEMSMVREFLYALGQTFPLDLSYGKYCKSEESGWNRPGFAPRCEVRCRFPEFLFDYLQEA
jgi:hypothetical protein